VASPSPRLRWRHSRTVSYLVRRPHGLDKHLVTRADFGAPQPIMGKPELVDDFASRLRRHCLDQSDYGLRKIQANNAVKSGMTMMRTQPAPTAKKSSGAMKLKPPPPAS